MYGLHLTDTWDGRVFSQATTPLGLALPIYTATAVCASGICGLPIWNPPGSNRMLELISVDIDYGSGTADFGSVGLMAAPLQAIATGQNCTALATSTPVNGLLGSGRASKAQSYNGASAVTTVAGTAAAPTSTSTAPGWWRSLASINLEAATGTAHGTGIQTYNFNGTALVPEGWLIYLAAGKASVALYACSIVWKEIPSNLNAA